MKITDYSRSTPGLWLGTAANANAIGGVSISSNSAALPGTIPVSISSNMFAWRDALSFGSNTNDVSSVGTMGSSPSNTRADHVHRGVHAITAAGSNALYGDVNLVAGTGMGITVAGQNVTLASSGGSSIGSNSTDVSGSTSLGGLTTYAPSTHLHRGVHSLSHTSNTFYGDVTLVAGAGVGITVPVPGSFALNATGGGGGGGGSGTVTTVKDEGSTLSTAVTSIDFVGAGVTATGTTAVTVTIPGGSGGGLTLLEQHTASASASLDFTTRNVTGQSGATIQSDFDEYEVHFVGVVPASATQALYMRMSTDGGSSYVAGTSYTYLNLYGGIADGITQQSGSGVAQIRLANAISATANWTVGGRLQLFEPGSSAYKFVTAHVVAAVGTNLYSWTATAVFLDTTAVDAFQFLFASGNIASGTIRVYGVAKT
jgi:hypothetical protein